MNLLIYGASDDLIEVEGDIREEFTYDEEPMLIGFSDGTLLTVQYDRLGIWRIQRVFSGSAVVTIEQAPINDDDNYTDRARITGITQWMVVGSQFAFRKENK